MSDTKIPNLPALPNSVLISGDELPVSSNGTTYKFNAANLNAVSSATIGVDNTIASFASTTTLTITGDVTDKYKSGDDIIIVGSTTNDGTYTLTIDSTETSGITTITVTGPWTVEAASGTVTGQTIDLDDANGVTGIFTVEASTDFTVLRILNPPAVEFRMYSEDGLIVTYSPTAVAGATTGQIVLESGSGIAIEGRGEVAQSDFLELQATSTYVRQINASILV